VKILSGPSKWPSWCIFCGSLVTWKEALCLLILYGFVLLYMILMSSFHTALHYVFYDLGLIWLATIVCSYPRSGVEITSKPFYDFYIFFLHISQKMNIDTYFICKGNTAFTSQSNNSKCLRTGNSNNLPKWKYHCIGDSIDRCWKLHGKPPRWLNIAQTSIVESLVAPTLLANTLWCTHE